MSKKVDMNVRKTRRGEKVRHEKAKVDFNQAGQLQDKIDVIAEYLGIKKLEEKE